MGGRSLTMTTAFVALGGNLGDVRATMSRAIIELNRLKNVKVTDVSHWYRTAAIGSQAIPVEDANGVFWNSAAAVETSLSPDELWEQMRQIEDKLGRLRTQHWGPRTLDLDLLLYGDEIIDQGKTLQVPHPRLWYRRFVLDPLVEIAPTQVHPRFGLTVQEILQRLMPRPLVVRVLGEVDLSSLIREFESKVEFCVGEREAALALKFHSRGGQPVTQDEMKHRLEASATVDLAIESDPLEAAAWVLRSALDVPQIEYHP